MLASIGIALNGMTGVTATPLVDHGSAAALIAGALYVTLPASKPLQWSGGRFGRRGAGGWPGSTRGRPRAGALHSCLAKKCQSSRDAWKRERAALCPLPAFSWAAFTRRDEGVALR
jgi:hypothetical protein